MDTLTTVARALSGLDPTDLVGGDQEALADFVADYFVDEQEKSLEGKPQLLFCFLCHPH